MSVATLQQLCEDLPARMALVRRGETVTITDGGQVFAARRRAIFGDKVFPSDTAQTLIAEERGE